MSDQDLNARVSVLEHMATAQNAVTNQRLNSIDSVLKEIHDKLDKSLTATPVEITRLDGRINLTDERHKNLNSKVNKVFGGVVSLIIAIVGGIASWSDALFKK